MNNSSRTTPRAQRRGGAALGEPRPGALPAPLVRLLGLALPALAAALLAGCTAPPVERDARQAYAQGRIEDSLAQLSAAMGNDRSNTSLRVAYLELRERGINDLLEQQAALSSPSAAGERTRLLRRVLAIDPANQRAKSELERIDADARAAKIMLDAQFAFDAKQYDLALDKVRAVLMQDPAHAQARALLKAIQDKSAKPQIDPALEAALAQKLTIDFKDANLKQVFEVLARTAEINFVMDKDIKADQRTSIFLKDVTVKNALQVLLITNQLEQRIINRSAILIYPNLPGKQKDYQALSVHTFFLANAEAEQVGATLKTILKTRDLTVDKTQNMLIMRDTPDAIEMAEKIVAMQDLPIPETMLEIEVLEVSRNRLDDIGVTYPSKLSLAPLSTTTGGTVTLDDLKHINSTTLGATVSPLVLNLSSTDSDVRLLANPRIRVKNRESAKILIGDKVPNITSTATSTGLLSESIQYIDVGLKVDVTPVISIDDEISIKVALEVSNIAGQVTTNSGTAAYQIGTRSASTVLRLKNGETQILAGLINDQDSRSITKIPGLGDLPVLGRLFADHNDSKQRTEIVLSITPRLIRNQRRPDGHLLDFPSGTESSLQGGGEFAATAVAPASAAPAPTPASPSATSGAPAAAAVSASSLGSGNTALDTPVAASVAGEAAVGGVAAGTPSLNWSGAAQVKVGDSFQQQLVLSTPVAVSGVMLVLGYDPAVLQATKVSEGTLLANDGTATSYTQRIDASTGQIFITDTRASTAVSGASGQGVLSNVTFTALKAAAPTELKVLTVTPTGYAGAAINLTAPTHSITVGEAQ